MPSGRSAARALVAACALCAIQGNIAQVSAAPLSAAQSGPVLELRYRYETVDDADYARDAEAYTLRVRLGYRWLFAPQWLAYVDGERVEGMFGQHYNSTANGHTLYPVVVDPQSSEVNQAFIAYQGDAVGSVLGRQRVVLDDQRFFGNSGWRQNEQTFDALSLRGGPGAAGEGPTIRYLYLDRVLRVNGQDNPHPLLREWDLRGHAFNLSQTLPIGTLVGYAYLVENLDIATYSTETFGARWTGVHSYDPISFGWAIEYARQSDWANNPSSQSADYSLIEPSISWRGVTLKAGREVLGGDGNYGFSTPYATLHIFNGWADRFLITPKDGLEDRYVSFTGKLGKAAWVTTWHYFHADSGNQHYGNEIDASLAYPFGSHVTALLKYADYHSDGFAADVRKLWASVEYTF